MSYIVRKYQCPSCEGIFTHLMERTEAPPQHCPLCGDYVGADPQVIPGFNISAGRAKNTAKSADQTYRMMEGQSAERAQAAADMAGCDVSEMSHLKITNMKDNMRQGDIAAITPPSAVSQAVAAMPNQGMQGNQWGEYFAEKSKSGPFAHAGDAMRQSVNARHHQVAAAVQRQGQIAGPKTPCKSD